MRRRRLASTAAQSSEWALSTQAAADELLSRVAEHLAVAIVDRGDFPFQGDLGIAHSGLMEDGAETFFADSQFGLGPLALPQGSGLPECDQQGHADDADGPGYPPGTLGGLHQIIGSPLAFQAVVGVLGHGGGQCAITKQIADFAAEFIRRAGGFEGGS